MKKILISVILLSLNIYISGCSSYRSNSGISVPEQIITKSNIIITSSSLNDVSCKTIKHIDVGVKKIANFVNDPSKEQVDYLLSKKAKELNANIVRNVKYKSGIGFTTWGYMDAEGDASKCNDHKIKSNISELESFNHKARMHIGIGYETGKGKGNIRYLNKSILKYDVSPQITKVKIGKTYNDFSKIEFIYSTNKMNDDATENIGIGINTIITMDKIKYINLVPYFPSGIEYISNSESKVSGIGIDLGIGAFYPINKNIELSFGYKINAYVLDSDINSLVKVNTVFQTAEFGLSYYPF